MLRCWCVSLLLLLLWPGLAEGQSDPSRQAAATLPVTTASAQARESFQRATRRLEEYRLSEALEDLRAAVSLDPNFAQAMVLISHLSPDPVEQAAARGRAKRLAVKVSPGERLLIRWLVGAQEDDYLPAIAAMNDLLAEYPGDERLPFLAGRWLIYQQRYQQAVIVLERAVMRSPNDPATLNELAYAYAFNGDFPKAFAAMDRYVALEPDQPNPHDSYGELLRMDGKFDAALEQYRLSVRMDPNFGSELGIADTYALMGKEEEAREEYQRAMIFAGSQGDKIQYELQSAMTWIRENDHKQAEKALGEVAKHAHAQGLARWETEAHRVLAMDEPDPKAGLKQLQAAQLALRDPHSLSESDRDEEQARVLRARATRLADAKDIASASEAVSQLEGMAAKSRSQVIQLCYQGAAGAVLSAQGKFAEAVTFLEEDSTDPLSMRLLWQAYSSTGAAAQALGLASKLAALNVPTADQALVVPQFRATVVSRVGQP